MRLQLAAGNFVHSDFVTACGWAGSDLYTCCDDKAVHQITAEGDHVKEVTKELTGFPTDLHWFPSANKNKQSDMFAAACSDGTCVLVKRNGSIERQFEAHKQGAVIAIRWNHEGTAIATAGEDGVVKIWSKTGQLRSTLAQTDSSVYSLSWAPDSNSLCFTSGKDVVVKPLQPQAKQFSWKAHDGTVLKVDWNPVNGLIVTGGEDRRYKVWDAFGRPVFASKPLEFPVTAVAWSPNGELFGVGLYNSIRLCDRTGWTYSRELIETGSITSISWTADCTQLAGTGANGAVVFGQVRLRFDSSLGVLQRALEACYCRLSSSGRCRRAWGEARAGSHLAFLSVFFFLSVCLDACMHA